MPVLSPHRSSVTGTYRSSLGSSTLNRYPPTYTPNYYYERYSSRSYTDSDGRRLFTRSGSITEDGKTTRFYEESRDGSVTRRESISRDSGIGSIRENSILDTTSGSKRDRESSLTRGDGPGRYTPLNVVDSLADLRNKYSPANYVPAVYRNNPERMARSKSINDIGRPPPAVEKDPKTAGRNAAKVKQHLCNGDLSVGFPNNINTSNDNVEAANDANGNDETTARPVSELRKKFEAEFGNDRNENRRPFKVSKLEPAGEKVPDRRPPSTGKNDTAVKVIVNGFPAAITKNSTVENGRRDDTEDSDDLDNSSSALSINEVSSESSTLTDGATRSGAGASSNRVSNFSSYIPVKPYEKGDLNGGDAIGKDGEAIVEKYASTTVNDLSTPQRLSKALSSHQNAAGTSTAIGAAANSVGRPSLERDESEKIYYEKKPTAAVSHQGLNGLKNIGNTCFMNSVIQCLSNTKPLLEYLRKDQYANEINTTISSMKGALIKAFAQVIKELWSEDSSDRVVNTVSLKSQIQRFAPRFMGYAQQDAQEFLRYLLEGLHEDVNRVTTKPAPIHTEIDEKLSDGEKSSESWQRYLRMDNSKIVDIFVGQLKSTLKCTHCGHCSVTFDPFWDLSLPIPQKVGPVRLQQCLDSFTREETLDGDEKPTCSKCKERRKCTKSFAIQKFPKILVIHLKRFSPMERFRGKLSVNVDFPLEGLDMSNYSADNHTQCRYNLYAISNHSGTTYSGHYTAYCRHPYSLAWHEYNDSRVSSISSKSIVSGEAYVLFYELDGQKSHL